MVRSAFIVFSLAVLATTSALAVRIDTVRTPAHATITKSTVHHTHRPARPVAHSSSRVVQHKTSSAAARSSHTTTRRGTRYASSTSHRVSSSASHSTTLRRTRYNRYHSQGHFVPLAAAPVPALRPESAERNTVSGPAFDSSASSFASKAEPHEAELTAADRENPRETDTLPAPGADRAAMAVAGNPLAAPHQGIQPIAPPSGQIAELNRPPIFTGRVSSYTLRGTHDSLVRQNARAEEDSLERIEDDADLQDRIARGLLVRVPESGGLIVNPALPEDRRYCRPWTADFLANLARDHQAQFHTPLVVSSAVRTVEYQKRLMRTNHNAAEAEGDIVSPHLTGSTIDIAKSGLSRKEMLWMRNQLLGYQNSGVLDVEEEFRQRCFHITVYKNYTPASQSHRLPQVAPVPAAPESDSTGATAASGLTPDEQ
jgi:hypothetical protein